MIKGSSQLPRRFLLLFLLVLCICSLLNVRSARTKAARPTAGVVAIQEAPTSSPTPLPSPSTTPKRKPSRLKRLGRAILDLLSCNEAKHKKERELSETGMQFPDAYSESDFTIVALVKGNWAVAVEYESEQRNTATVTFAVDGIEPFTQALPAQDGGPNQPTVLTAASTNTMVFRLPERFGTTPQAADITFRAFTDGPNGKVPGNFHLTALGIGDRALESALLKRPGPQTVGSGELQVEAAHQSLQPFYEFGNRQAGMPKAVAIVNVNVTPSVVNSSRGGTFDYYFVSTNNFSVWRAEYRRNIMVPVAGGRESPGTEYIGRKDFNEPVFAGPNPQPPPPKKSKHWSIRGGNKYSRGLYKITVFAWFKPNAFQQGGEAAVRTSGPVSIY